MACEHGVSREARCDRCEEIAAAEMSVHERAEREFERLTATPNDKRKERATQLISQAKGYAHCNCPEDEETGRVTRHSNCQRHLMPILNELETLL